MSISSVPCGSSTGFVKGSPLSGIGVYTVCPFPSRRLPPGRLRLRRGGPPCFSCCLWLSPHFRRKFCVRIAQEPRLATRSTQSIPRFVCFRVFSPPNASSLCSGFMERNDVPVVSEQAFETLIKQSSRARDWREALDRTVD